MPDLYQVFVLSADYGAFVVPLFSPFNMDYKGCD